ncbi:uncharacterized protein LOC133198340 [Saccostrea echinata]|uniref:uncharacterized protein LOC133198340 n=1 Tax=Saccostrea echinata TaxID=191078 RepID=UPI002A7FD6E9|nr:uncharacterized protein LOC133198340 [Saccostrea echinata]
MIKIDWKNNNGPIMRDRFQKICTETTVRTEKTTTTTPFTSTLSEKHETTALNGKTTTTKETTRFAVLVETPFMTTKKHGTSIEDLKEKFLKAMNSSDGEKGSLTDMALGFLMWAIAASVATLIILVKKWLTKKCCNIDDEENNDDHHQQTPPISNPTFSPGQLSLVPLMVMHTPPASSISSAPSSTPEIEDEEEEEEEEEKPVRHRTRRSCAKRLNFSKTSVV